MVMLSLVNLQIARFPSISRSRQNQPNSLEIMRHRNSYKRAVKKLTTKGHGLSDATCF